MTSLSNFFDVVLFLFSSLVIGPSFMSISSLIIELRQFSFIRYWSEIRKSEKHSSEFCPISGLWSQLGILNLARKSLMKCYWMLPNTRAIVFTLSELLRGKPTGRSKIYPPPPRKLGLSAYPTKWLNTLKNLVDCCPRIVWVCLTVLWGWYLNG